MRNQPILDGFQEIRRRHRVVVTFPDGQSALILCTARLRHIAGSKWGQKGYLNTDLLKDYRMEKQIEVASA